MGLLSFGAEGLPGVLGGAGLLLPPGGWRSVVVGLGVESCVEGLRGFGLSLGGVLGLRGFPAGGLGVDGLDGSVALSVPAGGEGLWMREAEGSLDIGGSFVEDLSLGEGVSMFVGVELLSFRAAVVDC